MAHHLIGVVSTVKLSKVCLAMNTVLSKFAPLEHKLGSTHSNLGVRAGIFCNVRFDFHAIRELLPARELFPGCFFWMTGWFHVLAIQRSHLAETPAQSPLSIPWGLPVGRSEVEVVVSCC